jgi:HEXXH motif-containing protein
MTSGPTLASFSHPGVDPDGRCALRAALIIGAARQYAQMLLRHCGSGLALASSGLSDLLTSWSEGEIRFEDALQVPLSLRAVQAGALDPLWVAAQIAAHLHAHGHEGRWRVRLGSPAPLAFGWRVTPSGRDVAVDAGEGHTRICVDNAPAPFAADVSQVRFGRAGVRIVGSGFQRVYPFKSLADISDLDAGDVASMLRETASLLEQYAPRYLDWVATALAAVVPLGRPGDDLFQSFSLRGVNAVVFASFPAPPLKLAELLVHETSHQYYHFAQYRTTFSNGKDEKLYYSPYVQKGRPIERILIGYHAFANVVLFYRACLAAGMRDGSDAAAKEIEHNMDCLRPMADVIDATAGLTPAARELFEPLRQELFS